MVVIELSCGHVYSINDRPRIDEPCKEGCGIRIVINEWPEKWHAVCSECPYHTRHGFARAYANESAAKHSNLTGHRTAVRWFADLPPEIRTRVRAEESLRKSLRKSSEPLAPPF